VMMMMIMMILVHWWWRRIRNQDQTRPHWRNVYLSTGNRGSLAVADSWAQYCLWLPLSIDGTIIRRSTVADGSYAKTKNLLGYGTLINSKQTVADVLTTQKGLLLTMGLLHLSMLPFNMISKFHHTFAWVVPHIFFYFLVQNLAWSTLSLFWSKVDMIEFRACLPPTTKWSLCPYQCCESKCKWF
jgi:hypothetical protein